MHSSGSFIGDEDRGDLAGATYLSRGGRIINMAVLDTTIRRVYR